MTWERDGGPGWDPTENPPRAEKGQGPHFLVCCPGITQELRSWEPGWLVWLPLTGCLPSTPNSAFLPRTQLHPIGQVHTKNKNRSKNNDHHKKNKGHCKPKQPMEASSPIARCPGPTAHRSHLPQAPGSAGLSSFPNWEVSHSVRTLTHTGLALAQRLGVVL